MREFVLYYLSKQGVEMCSFLKRTDIYLKKVKSKEILANIKIGVKNYIGTQRGDTCNGSMRFKSSTPSK